MAKQQHLVNFIYFLSMYLLICIYIGFPPLQRQEVIECLGSKIEKVVFISQGTT